MGGFGRQSKRDHLGASPKKTNEFRQLHIAFTQSSTLAICNGKCKWKRALGKRQVTRKIRFLRADASQGNAVASFRTPSRICRGLLAA